MSAEKRAFLSNFLDPFRFFRACRLYPTSMCSAYSRRIRTSEAPQSLLVEEKVDVALAEGLGKRS
jgi:hypothetical protein